jgi:hypothetical protein
MAKCDTTIASCALYHDHQVLSLTKENLKRMNDRSRQALVAAEEDEHQSKNITRINPTRNGRNRFNGGAPKWLGCFLCNGYQMYICCADKTRIHESLVARNNRTIKQNEGEEEEERELTNKKAKQQLQIVAIIMRLNRPLLLERIPRNDHQEKNPTTTNPNTFLLIRPNIKREIHHVMVMLFYLSSS